MFSFNFNGTDMTNYGLTLLHEMPFTQDTPSIQLLDRAYGLTSVRPAKSISLIVKVVASSIGTLRGYLDSIKSALNIRTDAVLKLDIYTDRYWLVRYADMQGSFRSPTLWQGTIIFTAHDPAAYDNTLTTSNYNIV